MTAYYNEIDPAAAAWLRELIAAELIAPGDVDERSITDVQPEDLKGYTQHHFFAGIGGWSLALRLAGWPDDRPVWTGSPPCQPFSAAGKRGGYDDDRHLAPAWLDLVGKCRPPVLFGEQVASAASNSKHHWLDDLQDALEAENYATGAVVLPACSVGAPHIRQRLWFVAQRVADGIGPRLEGHAGHGNERHEPGRIDSQQDGSTAAQGVAGGMADASVSGCREERPHAGRGFTGDPAQGEPAGRGAGGSDSGMANASSERRQQDPRGAHGHEKTHGRTGRNGREQDHDHQPPGDGEVHGSSPDHGVWSDTDWLLCRDGKWRPVESSIFGLAHGVSERMVRSGTERSAAYPLTEKAEARVMRLKGYGNAIVPGVAAQVIRALMEV